MLDVADAAMTEASVPDGSEPFALFRDDLAGRDTLFRAPRRIISARDEEGFAAALDAMEAARSEGKWLAGYFSYEAGYLLEPKLRPLIPQARRAPLASFGVFDSPSGAPLAPSRPSNGPIF